MTPLDLDLVINEAQLAVVARQNDARKYHDPDMTAEQLAAQAIALHDAFSLLWLISRDAKLQKAVRTKMVSYLPNDTQRQRLERPSGDAAQAPMAPSAPPSAERSEAQGARRPGASAGHQHDGGSLSSATHQQVSEARFSGEVTRRR